MTKFAKLKECLSDVWNCKKFWIGFYYCLFIISIANLATDLVKRDITIINLILFLWTGLVTLFGIHKYYWPGKEMDKTEE
jgi:hypothetical protein